MPRVGRKTSIPEMLKRTPERAVAENQSIPLMNLES